MVVTIGNFKGGVAKTRTTITLGAALVRRGYKVLIIDYDGQRNATTNSVGRFEESDKTVVSWMQRKSTFEDTVFTDVAGWGFDLMPASILLGDFDAQFQAMGRESVLKRAITNDRLNERYDVILIDTAPAAGNTMISALVASDELLVPTSVNGEGIDGADTIIRTAAGIREYYNPRLKVDGVLFTMAQTHYKSVMDCYQAAVDMLDDDVYVYQTMIRLSTAGSVISWGSMDICTAYPTNNIAIDYEAFTDEWVSRHITTGGGETK